MYPINKPKPPVRCRKQRAQGRCKRNAVSLSKIAFPRGAIVVFPLCFKCRKAFQSKNMLIEWVPLTAENRDPNQYHLFELGGLK